MFFGTVERPPRLSEFEIEVPEKLIAQHPSKSRDKCKLMIVNKEKSFDKSLKGDFSLINNKISRKNNLNYIYTGLQIIDPKAFFKINKK